MTVRRAWPDYVRVVKSNPTFYAGHFSEFWSAAASLLARGTPAFGRIATRPKRHGHGISVGASYRVVDVCKKAFNRGTDQMPRLFSNIQWPRLHARLLLAASLGVALHIASATDVRAQATDSELRWGVVMEIGTIDPVYATNNWETTVSFNLYDPLIHH